MATTSEKYRLHDLKGVNTALGMLYDKDGNYRPGFKPEEFYNTILLDTLKYGEENFVHLAYAETVNIRKGEKVAKFRRWSGLTPTKHPLKEGVPNAPDKTAYEYMEVGNVFSIGRWSEYTDAVDMSIINEVIAERSLQYGENANQTKELYAREAWLACPNAFYANFKDGFEGLAFGDDVKLDDLRFLIARMKRMQVKPIGGKFNYICSPEFINGLIDDPRVVKYMDYEQTTGNMFTTGQPFDLFDLKFIPTMLDEFAYPDVTFPGVFENEEGKEVIRLYGIGDVSGTETLFYLDIHQDFQTGTTSADKAKTQYADDAYLADGTSAEGLFKWDVPKTLTLSSSNVQATSATSAKCRLMKSTKGTDGKWQPPVDGTANYTAANTVIAAGGFMQLPVHRGILFGDEAMIKLNIEGLSDAPQIIIQPLGSAGANDPYKQRQTVAYRIDGFGLAIKRPEAICITYGIPANAEFAALTAAYIAGEPTILDNSKNAATDFNRINANGNEQNMDQVVGKEFKIKESLTAGALRAFGTDAYVCATNYTFGGTVTATMSTTKGTVYGYGHNFYEAITAQTYSSTNIKLPDDANAATYWKKVTAKDVVEAHCVKVEGLPVGVITKLFDNVAEKGNDPESNVN